MGDGTREGGGRSHSLRPPVPGSDGGALTETQSPVREKDSDGRILSERGRNVGVPCSWGVSWGSVTTCVGARPDPCTGRGAGVTSVVTGDGWNGTSYGGGGRPPPLHLSHCTGPRTLGRQAPSPLTQRPSIRSRGPLSVCPPRLGTLSPYSKPSSTHPVQDLGLPRVLDGWPLVRRSPNRGWRHCRSV